jgi:chitinase
MKAAWLLLSALVAVGCASAPTISTGAVSTQTPELAPTPDTVTATAIRTHVDKVLVTRTISGVPVVSTLYLTSTETLPGTTRTLPGHTTTDTTTQTKTHTATQTDTATVTRTATQTVTETVTQTVTETVTETGTGTAGP